MNILNKVSSKPYSLFYELFAKAQENQQEVIESMLIASFDKEKNEVDARYVNLKYINKEQWIFFTNYNSPKSQHFNNHSQITAVFYWHKIKTQIRIKANINKTSKDFNKAYFKNRDSKKNAIAISSLQSMKIESYKKVKDNYNLSIKKDSLQSCPDYWGGYSFTPFYFEFWEGHKSRLNKRDAFILKGGIWDHSILQP